MIRSFLDKEVERIFDQKYSTRIPRNLQDRALVKLMLLDAAEEVSDLRSPPGNRFEYLTGKMKGRCSLRINQKWRVTFRFEDGDAFEVKIEDYH